MSADGLSFGERLEKVKERIEKSRTSYSPREIQILAVSKGQSGEKILDAHVHCRQKMFGENYVQEALDKQETVIGSLIEWHFIGHLQSNKVKSVVGAFELIHSVDRLDLFKEINKRADHKEITQKVLIEVNIANEKSKSGIAPAELPKLVEQAAAFPRVKIEGLMCMPPLGLPESLTRNYFSQTRELARKHGLQQLSMGTSDDFEWAVAEGATILRLGTVLFGPRSKK